MKLAKIMLFAATAIGVAVWAIEFTQICVWSPHYPAICFGALFGIYGGVAILYFQRHNVDQMYVMVPAITITLATYGLLIAALFAPAAANIFQMYREMHWSVLDHDTFQLVSPFLLTACWLTAAIMATREWRSIVRAPAVAA